MQENVLPDALGVRKPPWYFVLPSFWGVGDATVREAVDLIEASTDVDVLEEEAAVQARCNGPPHADSAVEVRGLVAEFRRAGKPLFAVKAPWYSVRRRSLLALLGPNGAGKTSTINMLTGVVPPARGNALVMGRTVAHPVGMSEVRRLMGVCTQFDTLWAQLTAREHMRLFAAIKGVPEAAIDVEATKGLEQVRLSECADRCAGTYSGGMRRRLSVALALMGNPQVVFLDEPTTGMDPINRRHVWDVIEAAKQDRCVILTTHSMEEADILGDCIAIMAKGRLRCLGSTVRLKSRFGAGYKISISLGDHSDAQSTQALAVRELMSRHLGCNAASESSKAYLRFVVPASAEGQMADTFKEIETRRAELGIVDVQIAMSTLEDVFLKLAKESEVEEAVRDNVTTTVTLSDGEKVEVLVGSEDHQVSPKGVGFVVAWQPDDQGALAVADTIEDQSVPVQVTTPAEDGATHATVEVGGAYHQVEVPPGLAAGETFSAHVHVRRDPSTVGPQGSGPEAQSVDREQVLARMERLQAPYTQQARALFRKNLAFQKRRRFTNVCLVLVPMMVLALMLVVQYVIEEYLLGEPRVRCPYCGPTDDDFGKGLPLVRAAPCCRSYLCALEPTPHAQKTCRHAGSAHVKTECVPRRSLLPWH